MNISIFSVPEQNELKFGLGLSQGFINGKQIRLQKGSEMYMGRHEEEESRGTADKNT